MPKRKDGQLTLREDRFVRFYAESRNASQSALRAGYKQRQSGYENLTKPHIRSSLSDNLEQAGITWDKIASVLRAGLDATVTGRPDGPPNYHIRHQYIMICLKILDPDIFGPARMRKKPVTVTTMPSFTVSIPECFKK